MNQLTAIEVAEERTRRQTEHERQCLIYQARLLVERWELSDSRRAVPSTRRLKSRLEELVAGLEKLGLEMIPTYIATLSLEFDLQVVRRSIEKMLDETFERAAGAALKELPRVGPTAGRIVDGARSRWRQAKSRIYQELQIQSHELRFKISRRKGRENAPKQGVTKTPIPEMVFVRDNVLRSFASRAATEACRCFDTEAYTAAAIMAGSAMETVLLDALQRRQTTSTKKDLSGCRLSDLIHLALTSGLLGQSTSQLTHWIRENRDLVHPGRVLRQRRTVEREEAEMCLSILKLICKELRRAKKQS